MNGSFLSAGGSSEDSGFEEIEIDLAAFMSIISKLLFFLLTSFGLGFMSLIAANVPTVSEENTVFTVNKAKVTATLAITTDGFSVTAANEMLGENELNALHKKFPLVKGDYDYKGLNEYMHSIKQKFTESDTVVITPDKDISYEILIRALDASREKLVIVEGKPLKYPLFPSAVVSTLVK